MSCELCIPQPDAVLRRDAYTVILVDDPAYPGFCRVIWNAHAKEMSDLTPAERVLLMEAVLQVELALVEVMAPDKINLASLGNVVPHVHWHVIPRFADDAHFPSPVWAKAARTTDSATLAARRALLPQLAGAIVRRLSH